MATQMPPMEPDKSPSDHPDETPTDSDYEYEHYVLANEGPEDNDDNRETG